MMDEEIRRMTPRYSRYLTLVVVLLVAGLAVFAVCCGRSDTEGASTTGGSVEATTVGSTASATNGSPGSTTSGSAAAASSTSSTGTFAGERTTTTVPEGESGVVEVKGLVDNPMTLKVEDVEKMTVVTVTVDKASGKQEYRGVRLSDLFDACKVQSAATRVTMTAHADGYVVDLSLQDIQWSPDALLAINDDGTLSVVIPGLDRKAWVENVVSLEFK
jgi:DMSO/TMAO reductase YedYZ molybdopterin-dependent catalytic subunit